MRTMSLFERDLLRRLIQDFARMLAAIVGMRQRGELDDAESELASYVNALLGQLAKDAEQLDSETLGKLLKVERLRHYALLIAERANLRAARGAHSEALEDRSRALELLLEARAKSGDTSDAQLIRELASEISLAGLAPRYRDLLSAG
ncbi:MAG TPA: hypothetical protein VFQ35_10360 [Polyangiaceae bacterium]|nr:hypothetical protein [Polyangiaceae bacterium]